MTEFLTWAILALRPDWQPEACEREFAAEASLVRCTAARDEGAAWAAELAGYITTEAERQDLDPLLMIAVAYRESRFKTGDVCRTEVPADRIVSRTTLADGVEELTITYRADPTRTSTLEVTVLSEQPDG
ncbi:MAG: hypothetical protein JXB32_08675, partial [Deltaproteobacteria bacterium]|nr:hypothetical protein [Deltaproteobacteria bacterium]